ncbi:MAG: zinc ribbon domain-containing protein, partial [Blastocatellia bacterium]|nr:zinc ribbon domain-containing protein [Blastocatellia bacterium]
MFCPHCGQERVSEATSFCSRCGYPLIATADLLRTGGAPLPTPTGGPRSPRSRGVRMGIFMFLLMF